MCISTSCTCCRFSTPKHWSKSIKNMAKTQHFFDIMRHILELRLAMLLNVSTCDFFKVISKKFSFSKYVVFLCHKVEIKCVYSELAYPTINLECKRIQKRNYSIFIQLCLFMICWYQITIRNRKEMLTYSFYKKNI